MTNRPGAPVARVLVTLVLGAAIAGCGSAGSARSGSTPHSSPVTAQAGPDAFAAIERRYGVRLGVAAIDTASGRRIGYRSGERFAFASTNKVFIAAATLRAGADPDALVRYRRGDVVPNSPVTSRHVGTGLTVGALIDAMLRYSDNTAANLLVGRLGGPARVQAFLRALGDPVTDVDRLEPQLNTAVPGDVRDTTTPDTFAADLRQVLLGVALDAGDRQALEQTMRRNTTGDATIRAGSPAGWVVADKTGTASYGTRNDIAVVRPSHRAPIVLIVFTTRTTRDAATVDAAVAAASRVVADDV